MGFFNRMNSKWTNSKWMVSKWMVSKWKILLLAAVVAVATPACFRFAAQTDSRTDAGSAGEQSESAFERLLLAAQAEFRDNGTLTAETADRFRQRKEMAVPIVVERLSLRTPTDDIPFWLAVAQAVEDEGMLEPLLRWLPEPPAGFYEHFLWREAFFQALSAYITEDNQADLIRQMDGTNAQSAALILELLESKHLLTEERIQAWEDRYFGRPPFEGIVQFLMMSRKNEALMRLYDRKNLSAADRRRVVESLAWSSPFGTSERTWLRRQARQTDDPYIEQLIDAQLVWKHGDREAAARLYDSGDKHGFALPLFSEVERFLVNTVPDGTLAQGIRQYEQVRGRSYFIRPEGGGYEPGGDDYDQPERAIPRWEAFLRDYPLHPAADDAAYRLARCYEMTGEYEKALYWFNQAVGLGDRDMIYDAEGLFLYVLDVEMTSADFARWDGRSLPAWVAPWAAYSQAVERMRDRDYGQAVEELKAFIAEYDGQDVFQGVFDADPESAMAGRTGGESYPFWERVKEQLGLAEQLMALDRAAKEAEGPDRARKQYELAAAIYHQPLLYYNHLWRGERQTFFWFGHIKTMGGNEALGRYIARFNHLVQAQAAFAQIDPDQADAETGAKTLFSMALGYGKLIEYGDEIAFYDTDAHLAQQLVETAKALLARYPDSPLADDGMMLMYDYTGDSAWLDEIVQRYPTGDQADRAKTIKDDMTKTIKDDMTKTIKDDI